MQLTFYPSILMKHVQHSLPADSLVPRNGGRKLQHRKERGFSLIAVITLMVLIALICMGLLSLSTISLRGGQRAEAMLRAQANARLALQLAIGELQKHAGLDQRVTAEADIISSNGFAGWNRNAGKKHYLGVYSTKEWHDRNSAGQRPSWQPYDKNRNKNAFRRWLVSGDPQNLVTLDYAQSAPDPTSSIEVVGDGSLGTNADAEDRVRVALENLQDNSGRVSGKIAWWVGDEGIKAKVNLSDQRSFPADLATWKTRLNTTNPATLGVERVEGFSSFDPTGQGLLEIPRLLSHNQISLFRNGQIPANNVKARFHDISLSSQGVLSDVALGGLKRDLSLPFELPSLKPTRGSSDWSYPLQSSDDLTNRPADYNSIWEFSNSGDQSSNFVLSGWGTYRPEWWSNKQGYIFSLPKSGAGSDRVGKKEYLRGPSWTSLRNYYRQYKREYEKLPSGDPSRRGGLNPTDNRTWLVQSYQPFSCHSSTLGSSPLSTTYTGDSPTIGGGYRSPSLWNPFYNYNQGFTGGKRPWSNLSFYSAGNAPVLTKLGLVISHYSENGVFRLVCDAVGTIWNPYNVPIETETFFTAIKLPGIRWTMEVERANGTREFWSFDGNNNFARGEKKDFPFEHLRIGVRDPVLNGDRPAKNIRLMPGEVRTFSLDYPTPQAYGYSNRAAAPGQFSNNWSGGVAVFASNWRPNPGDRVRVKFEPDATKMLSIQSFLGYYTNLTGSAMNPFVAGSNGTNYFDLPELSGVHITNAADAFKGKANFETTISNFPTSAANKEALVYIELKRHASDTSENGIASEVDPRSIVNHTLSEGPGSYGTIPHGWDMNIKQVSDFDLIQAGVGPRNNGFFGTSHEGSGEPNVVFYEVPDAPLNSIGALQSCQMSVAGWDAPYAIGNSFPHPKVPHSNLIKEESATANGVSFQNVLYDMPYLSNEGLWDRYYFSGIRLPEDATTANALTSLETLMRQFLDPSQPNPLSNRRLVLASTSPGKTSDQAVKELTHYRWIARHLMLDGAFNINSTRVEAWKAMLSSLRKEAIDKVSVSTGSLSTTSGDGTPFSRMMITAGDEGEAWRGYASLSDSQIDTLAQKIVDEVKLRGPFLSVADFVNRRLANDETGNLGALQAALEKASLNTGSNKEKGIPGTIRQGDLLVPLGSSITARSDTFTIRAYGEAVNPGNGQVTARAWCEATVQRQPLTVGDNGQLTDLANTGYPGSNPAGTDAYIDNPAISANARTFGRKFTLVSFRWLSPQEV